MQAGLDARVALGCDHKRALEAHQLSLPFQGQVDEHLGNVHAEALLRWVQTQRGLLRPEHFCRWPSRTGSSYPSVFGSSTRRTHN